MTRLIQIVVYLIAASVLLAACSSGPLRSFNTGDELHSYDFSEAATFEEGAYSDATLRINDGVYRISLNQGDSEVWWAQWGDTLSNTVTEVAVEQVSEPNENAYGLACRLRGYVGQEAAVDPVLAALASGEAEATEEATQDVTEEAAEEATEEATQEATNDESAEDEMGEESSLEDSLPNGDGYLFLIRGSGSYAILRSRGRSLTPLVDWTASEHINIGPARNELRAVCVGDYLALYINGEFAGDATDTTYTEGQIGLAASASNRLGVTVEFDDLTIHAAEPA